MRVTLATICLLLLATGALAQSDRGTITGSVNDPNGAVVARAEVIVRNVAAGTEYKTVTTATGNYTISSLPAGSYELRVEAPGFKKFVLQGVQVQLLQTTRIDAALEIGAASDTVTVQATSPLLQTESAEQSTNISGRLFNSMPLNFGVTNSIRGWLSFIQLAPGVSVPNQTQPQTANINGAPGGSFKIYLEGQDVTSTNDTVWTSTVASASVETIGEFAIQTNNFSAEFGQVLGGVFNFTTKSGTNEFHGSVYEFLTNEALGARLPLSTPFSFNPRAPKALNRKHDYGFSVGGPVRLPWLYDGRNKTFFFFNLEKYRNVTRSSGALTTLPTAAYRQGDFSAALTGRQLGVDVLGRPIMENAIYDPRTTRSVTVDGKQFVVRDPFPNNVIPRELLDPVALKIQALIPSADNNELTANWDPRILNQRFQQIPSVKIDHNFNQNSKLSGYWSVQDTTQFTGPDGLPIPLTSRRDQKIYGHSVRLNLDQTISPRFTLHLGAGYLRFHNPDSAPDDVINFDALSELGFSGASTEPSGFPRIVGPGLGNLQGSRGGMSAMGPVQANKFWNDKLTGVANATWVRGAHTYKFGGEFKQEVWSDSNLTAAQGRLAFSEEQTGLPYLASTTVGSGSIGYRYASFLLGIPDTATVSAPKQVQWRKQAWSFYAQDDWKATPNLTVNYGLRWDYAGQGHELHYRSSMIDLTTPNPSAGGLPGAFIYEGFGPGRCDCTFTKAYPYAFGPRLSIAYRLNDKTVARAGWGVSYSQLGNWWYVTGGSPTLGLGFNSIDFSNPAFGEPALLLRNGLQYNRSDLFAASLDPGIRPLPGQTSSFGDFWWGVRVDRNGGRPGRVNQWNIAVQRELVKDLTVEVAYVGNRGVWLEANDLVNANAIDPARLQALGLDLNNPADRALLTTRLIDLTPAQAQRFPAPYSGFPRTATVAQSLRPFPQFADGLAVRWAPLGNNWYDSLQVTLTKRYSRGLELTAAYTWQKELVLGSGGNPGLPGPGTNNVFNRDAQKSLASTSTPHIFVTGFTYLTPRWGQNKLVRNVLGNWTVGAVLRYASGQLIGAPGARNNLGTLIFQGTRMNRVPGQPLFLKDPNCGCIDPRQDLVLNPAAWTDAPLGQFGAGAGFYSDYRWQRQVSENMSLGRRFTIKEKLKFDIRAEFFNIFNRLNLPFPASGNPTATITRNQGELSGGFGFINVSNVGGQRNGQLVARFEF
jgi:Carboxypeptidase regulatory-like domain/TonB dependent receptor-like, beta-barrel